MYRDEKLSHYVYAPYILKDAGGEFTIQEESDNWFSHHYRKNYINGPNAGKLIKISKKEFKFWKEEAKTLWGTTDIWGNFVPGLLRPTLPKIKIDESYLSM